MDVVHSMERETPHVPWANPLSGGPITAWLMPPVVAGRDLVELAQRLELRYDTLTLDVSGHNTWGFGDFYGRRGRGTNYEVDYGYLTEDLTAAQHYDVLVLPGTHAWQLFPEAARKALVERVRSGAGLVLIGPNCAPDQLGEFADLSPLTPLAGEPVVGEPWRAAAPHWITRGVPFDLLPFDQMSRKPYAPHGDVLLTAGDGPVLAVGTFGQGRVVAFGYVNFGFSPKIANPWGVEKPYEYWEVYYSLLCRAVTWAAKREPPGTSLAATVSDRALTLNVTGGAALLTAHITLRDDRSRPEHVLTQAVQNGSAVVPLPALKHGGLHFAEVILKDEAGTVDWATVTFDVPRPVTVAAVTLNQDVVPRGEVVTGKVRLESSTPTDVVLDLTFLDNFGRVLDRAQKTVKGTAKPKTSVAFSLGTRHCLTRLGRVLAEVRQGERVLAHGTAVTFVRIPQVWEDYEIIMDRFLPEPAPGRWPAIARSLDDMHVSVMGAISAEMAKHVNFMIQADVVAYGFHPKYHQPQWSQNKKLFAETGDKKYLIRQPCYTAPEFRRQFRESLETKVRQFARFSPISYYAYEEPALGYFADGTDICWSPTCLSGFRDWLRRTYGTLGALNQEWGTTYKRWGDVLPLTTAEAQRAGNYAPWADHRTFMEWMWADVYREGHGLIRAIDPNATVCLSGNQDCTPHNGYDYSRLNHYVDQMQQYTGWNVEDFDRSFYPGMKLTGCTGYGVSGADLSLQLWGRLFHGEHAGCVIFWEISCLNPDLTFCKSGRDLARHFGELRGGGIARLLSFAQWDHCGVAIHYSFPSFHGTWITDGKITGERRNESEAFDLFDRGRVAWTVLLETLGFQYDFVAPDQIEAGDLTKRGFRVLVLPESVALSDAEAKQIAAFVKAGGVLLADLWPGVMDEHCKWRPTGALDKVFGLAHRKVQPADFRLREVGDRITLRQAEADWCPGHPSITRHTFGKGQAFSLGFSLAPMIARPRQFPEAKPDRFLDALGKVLEAAGIAPPAQVTEDGRPAATCEVFHFTAQGAEYFGLVRYRGQAEGDADVHGSVPPVAGSRPGVAGRLVRLVFPRAGHVYDVRERRHLGWIDFVEPDLGVGDAKLYALLPYTVERVDVSAPKEVAAGDEVRYAVRVTASGGATPGNHVVVIGVYAPSGEAVRMYAARVPLSAGRGQGAIPLALSDAPGAWRLTATDVVSSVSGETTFVVNGWHP